MMNAIRRLLRDHEEIGKLFNQFIEVGDLVCWQKKFIAERVIEAITKHVELEEKILFPAFKEKGGEEAEEMVLEGIEEHQVMEFMMERLKETQPEDKTFYVKFKVLMESSKHHFMEEECLLFPKVKQVLNSELDHLGEEMCALKLQMMIEPPTQALPGKQ